MSDYHGMNDYTCLCVCKTCRGCACEPLATQALERVPDLAVTELCKGSQQPGRKLFGPLEIPHAPNVVWTLLSRNSRWAFTWPKRHVTCFSRVAFYLRLLKLLMLGVTEHGHGME